MAGRRSGASSSSASRSWTTSALRGKPTGSVGDPAFQETAGVERNAINEETNSCLTDHNRNESFSTDSWDVLAMCSDAYRPRLGSLHRLWLSTAMQEESSNKNNGETKRSHSFFDRTLQPDAGAALFPESREDASEDGIRRAAKFVWRAATSRNISHEKEEEKDKEKEVENEKDGEGDGDMPLVFEPPMHSPYVTTTRQFQASPNPFLEEKTTKSPLQNSALSHYCPASQLPPPRKSSQLAKLAKVQLSKATEPSPTKFFISRKAIDAADARAKALETQFCDDGSFCKLKASSLLPALFDQEVAPESEKIQPQQCCVVVGETDGETDGEGRSVKRRRFSLDGHSLCSTSKAYKKGTRAEATSALACQVRTPSLSDQQSSRERDAGKAARGTEAKLLFASARNPSVSDSESREHQSGDHRCFASAAPIRSLHRKRKRCEGEARLFLLQRPAVATNAASGKALLEVLGTALSAEETAQLRKQQLEEEKKKLAKAAKENEELRRQKEAESERGETATSFLQDALSTGGLQAPQTLLPDICISKQAVCTPQHLAAPSSLKTPPTTTVLPAMQSRESWNDQQGQPAFSAPSLNSSSNSSLPQSHASPVRASRLRTLQSDGNPLCSLLPLPTTASSEGISVGSVSCPVSAFQPAVVSGTETSAPHLFGSPTSPSLPTQLAESSSAMAAFGSAAIFQPSGGEAFNERSGFILPFLPLLHKDASLVLLFAGPNPFGFQAGRARRRRR